MDLAALDAELRVVRVLQEEHAPTARQLLAEDRGDNPLLSDALDAEAEQHDLLWQASNEAFRDHWGFSEPDDKDYAEWRNSRWFQPQLWQVAWDGDEVVGQVQNFIDTLENQDYKRQRGYTEGISVRRPWRGRGVAKALIVRSMYMHKALGMTEVALGVDTNNPNGALKLYESLGYKAYKTLIVYRKPMPGQEK